MQIVGSGEVRNRFGALLDLVQREPVTIAKNGRPVAVVMSAVEYERLMAYEDYVLLQKIEQAEKEGFLGVEETAAFLAEMNARHAGA